MSRKHIFQRIILQTDPSHRGSLPSPLVANLSMIFLVKKVKEKTTLRACYMDDAFSTWKNMIRKHINNKQIQFILTSEPDKYLPCLAIFNTKTSNDHFRLTPTRHHPTIHQRSKQWSTFSYPDTLNW